MFEPLPRPPLPFAFICKTTLLPFVSFHFQFSHFGDIAIVFALLALLPVPIVFMFEAMYFLPTIRFQLSHFLIVAIVF